MSLHIVLTILLGLSSGTAAAPPEENQARSAKVYFLKGLLLQRRGEAAAALGEYEKAFARDKLSPAICRQAVELALDSGLADAALEWALRLKALEPDSAQSHVLTGRALWALSRPEPAQASFEAALKLDPKSAESIFSLGNLLSASEPEKARAMFLRFIQQDPEHAAEAHYQLGLLDHRLGRVPEAVKQLRKAVSLEPSAVQARYSLAQIFEVSRDTAAALSEYLEILRYEPQNLALLNHIGEIYFVQRELAQAKTKFLAALAVAPSDPAATHWLAMILESEGDYAAAAERVKSSSALASDAGLNLRLSYYLTQAGNIKGAVSVLENANKRWPANDEIAYFLALGYDDLKSSDKAVALLRGLLKVKPDYRDARYQLAVLLEKYGRMSESEVEFRELLERKPEDAVILNYLGYSLADRGLKLAEALELIEHAVRLDPGNGAYQDSLGWVHYKMGHSSRAVSELTAASEKLPHDATIRDHLGDALKADGRLEEAWKAWKTSQALDPASGKAQKKSSRIEKKFSPEILGENYLEYLRGLHSGIRKYSGLCEIKGLILGRPFAYNAILTYRDPSLLELDLLGPLFTPLLRMRLSGTEFVMDPIPLEGLDPGVVHEAVYEALSMMRDYLSGAVYSGRPARWRSGWRRSEVGVPGWKLGLGAGALRLESLSAENSSALRLDLGEFSVKAGRHLPAQMTVTGRGYALDFRVQKSNVEYK